MAFYAYGGRGVIQLPTQACNKALQRYDRTETGRLTTGHLQRRVATGKRGVCQDSCRKFFCE